MISDKLTSQIKSNYHIENILEISKLEGGYWNETLKLETDRGNFVLRISRPRTAPESISYQHDLMRFMNAKIAEVPAPIVLVSGNTFFVDESRVVILLPFIEGENASRKDPKHHIIAAGLLARLHRLGLEFPNKDRRFGYSPLAEFDWENNSNWHLPAIENLLETGAEGLKKSLIPPIGERAFDCITEIIVRRRQIQEELSGVRRWIEQLKSSGQKLKFAPTHGDFYPSNLLVKDDKISAVLDWDECQPEWLACELGRAMWEFCRDDDQAAMKAEYVKVFLQSYRAAGGMVPDSEIDLLENFIRCVRVQEVLFSFGEVLHGEWWEPEYTLYNLEALDNIKRGAVVV